MNINAAENISDEPFLWPVKIAQIDTIWERALPEVERAVARADGLFDADDIYWGLQDGAMQLWIVFKGQDIAAVCITEIVQFPGRKIVRAFALSGYGLAEWYNLMNLGLPWAIENGAEEWQATVADERFVKLLERKGWKRTHTIMTLPIDKGAS